MTLAEARAIAEEEAEAIFQETGEVASSATIASWAQEILRDKQRDDQQGLYDRMERD
jgi:hypothetical protein